MNNMNRAVAIWLFLLSVTISSLYALDQFPKGFSCIELSDFDIENSEKISKKDQEALFKKYGYVVSVKNIIDELLVAISEWKIARVKYLWSLLVCSDGLSQLNQHGYIINDFFLKAVEVGSLKLLKFFLAMPEVDINAKNVKGFNAFDLALYNAHNWWRYLGCQFSWIKSSRSDIKIISGGHLRCAYFLAKRGIKISPCLLQDGKTVDSKIKSYWNAPQFECLQYVKMTSFLLYKIEVEKEKKSILCSLRELFG